MPRQSAASFNVVSVNGVQTRLSPPPNLSARERAIFIDVVAGCAPKHFQTSDMPLLCAFVQAAALREQAGVELQRDGAVRKDGTINPWLSISERAVRTLLSLTSKLKLSPQSRMAYTSTPKAPAANVYERMLMEHDEAG